MDVRHVMMEQLVTVVWQDTLKMKIVDVPSVQLIHLQPLVVSQAVQAVVMENLLLLVLILAAVIPSIS